MFKLLDKCIVAFVVLIVPLFMVPSSAEAHETSGVMTSTELSLEGEIPEISDSQLSVLPKLTDTELRDTLTDPEEIMLTESTPWFLGKSFSREKSQVMDVVDTYNKYYLMAVVGKKIDLPKTMTLDQNLLEELNARQAYYVSTLSDEEIYTGYALHLDVKDIAIKDDLAKVVVERKITMQMLFPNGKAFDVPFGQSEGYVLKKVNGQWYLLNVIFDTAQLESETINALMACTNPLDWERQYSYENLPREKYEGENFKDNYRADGSYVPQDLLSYEIEKTYTKMRGSNDAQLNTVAGYSKQKAERYAIKHGANPNRDYIQFGLLNGGDCTNFVSQCLFSGGLV